MNWGENIFSFKVIFGEHVHFLNILRTRMSAMDRCSMKKYILVTCEEEKGRGGSEKDVRKMHFALSPTHKKKNTWFNIRERERKKKGKIPGNECTLYWWSEVSAGEIHHAFMKYDGIKKPPPPLPSKYLPDMSAPPPLVLDSLQKQTPI